MERHKPGRAEEGVMVKVTVPMSSSQTEALFPRKLSSRSQVSGWDSFIRFPALQESHGPGRRLREKACRLEGYLERKRKSLSFQSQLKITQERKGEPVNASQSCFQATSAQTNVAGVRNTGIGAMNVEESWGFPHGMYVRSVSSHL